MRSGNWSRPALTEDWQNGGFGLYVHWPFCESKCPYCDFNSHVQKHIDQKAWASAYANEIKRVGALTKGRVLRSVYFGGGTPSLMEIPTLETILDEVRDTWTLSNDVEITLEANPGSVEIDRFRGYRDAGVNRVSLGVQALNDGDLARLGRLHSVDEARRAIQISQNVFDRSSFDLIYARQNQSLNQWKTELEQALALNAGHLSLYQLTIEQGTAFGDRYNAGKLRGLPPDDLAADMYDLTQEMCEAHGLPAYEVSNHAYPGNESRHNIVYWKYGDYAGIGPGAHGRLTLDGQKYATVAKSNPRMWLESHLGGKAETVEPLSPQDMATELIMMGLRLNEPLDIQRFERVALQSFPTETGQYLHDIGMVEFKDQSIIVTPKGRPVLNAVIAELISALA
ncbi:radical SAM family heme chaperone HemW [Primorskyibacter aestuariivivens]|uniref:radical SAM family heme chaperone HemW n=1 Tax=Primorskyibacter aestuariivivens TaxID=1888912 RepID=UPI0023000059|nr:radical SAM family heme chaperone HemW [Primorskyibacter aestuariivivens]MDA7427688.1 radical SAM family heme chaperone HemW [Primorskyibacter aestuariivivens]